MKGFLEKSFKFNFFVVKLSALLSAVVLLKSLKQIVWTQIRLLHMEQSDLSPYCLYPS